ncbi:sigma-54 interaction domain-containing protein [Glacieibacterium megasporae]|uniref:sigma-54 interaction domain-containing protein n=1 Tax=Glacieibacterium megasporae TaxID=2835787 RepID=UPI001C1E1846|nr:sigma-54 dependent transcriptional regulator [Polymorphobacter megasporae]UAJ09659.1 sigma-54 dependent transcriptional regulator [Polymorphobacter megasporae]
MKAPASPPTKLAELIGASPAIVKVRALVDQLAASSVSVLVTGPSGSGKEVVAQLLHQRSSRAAKPFVAINCAAIPRDLLESEIFGHEAGSFTGAAKARRGRFELADTGTLFLDEIGDMPAEFQVKLLRILETRLVERVGGMLAFPVDVRLIAATNVDLAEAVASGRFREDLFYRLAVVEIRLPGLAERASDVPLLLEHFARNSERPRVGFTAGATDYLASQPWRGNVRELRNFVARATALHPGALVDRTLAATLLHGERHILALPTTLPLPDRGPWRDGEPIDLKAVLDDVEQAYIRDALGRTAGGIAGSARLLGLRRTTLIEKMRRLQIERPADC